MFALNAPRGFANGDFNADGYADIVVAPTYATMQPRLPIQFWINQGNGAFANLTTSVVEGEVPLPGGPIHIFVADFNGDTRHDVFIVDTGLEDNNGYFPGFDGGSNHVLLSQANGKLKDMSTYSLPLNPPRFNHVSSMGDINGDGRVDIVVTRLGGPKFPGYGTVALLNDGTGRFQESIQGLPADIAYRLTTAPVPPDPQGTGANGIADLDGDGRLDLVTGSYNSNDPVSGTRTVRFYQQSGSGSFVERGRVAIPAALAGIGYFFDTIGPDGAGLGVAGIQGADLNGDGRTDLVVLWEGAGKSYIEVLRNEGGFTFSDVTVAWRGTYNDAIMIDGFRYPIMAHQLRDLNRDGHIDLFNTNFGVTPTFLWSQGGFAFLNDGTGQFEPLTYRAIDANFTFANFLTALGCDWCGHKQMFFDANRDGRLDMVLIDNTSHITSDLPHRETEVIVQTFVGVGVPSPFIDGTLIAGTTPVRAAHITELRQRIGAIRSRLKLSVFVYTDAVLAAGSTVIRAQHIVEMREALRAAYVAEGLPPPTFSDSGLATGFVVKASHIAELRAATAALE